jgi:hypothetical protein
LKSREKSRKSTARGARGARERREELGLCAWSLNGKEKLRREFPGESEAQIRQRLLLWMAQDG